MTGGSQSGKGDDKRAERLGAALRANLRRRKSAGQASAKPRDGSPDRIAPDRIADDQTTETGALARRTAPLKPVKARRTDDNDD